MRSLLKSAGIVMVRAEQRRSKPRERQPGNPEIESRATVSGKSNCCPEIVHFHMLVDCSDLIMNLQATAHLCAFHWTRNDSGV